MQSVKKFSGKAQAGFTLIELIVVIVILGILAATALPRFADLGADARLAKLQGARAAVQTASALGHSAWLTRGSPAGGTSIQMEGTNVAINGTGYPNATGIVAAAGGLADYVRTPTDEVSVAISTDTSHATCVFTYTAATGTVGTMPDVTACD